MEIGVEPESGPGLALFGWSHLVPLLLLAAAVLALPLARRLDERHRAVARWSMVSALWLAEIGWHVWYLATGQWNVTIALPLHLCSIFVWVTGATLLTRKSPLFEASYLLGVPGAVQALLTPDIGPYDFPHVRWLIYFISHGLLVLAPLWLAIVEGFRPTLRSVARVLIGGNVVAAVVFVVNQAIGSNYMFLARKPGSASLLDVLGPWPVYLVWLEVLALIMVGLMYVPYAVGDRFRRDRSRPAVAP